MTTVEVNWVAVLVAAVVSMVVGMVWYMPAVLGNTWMDAIGKKKEDLGKSSAPMVWAVVVALVMAYVMAHFVSYAGATDFMSGAVTGFWAWLGLVATSMLLNNIFENRPMKLFWINSLYQLVNLVLIGGILASWK